MIFAAMNVHIRPATVADCAKLWELVHELAVYERAPEAHTATVADYERDLAAGIFEALVAEVDGLVVGMAFYYMTYSTWRGRMLYLEDFVVSEAMRGSGVGMLLFRRFLEVAREKGCVLTKWQVLDWNTPAVNFYEKVGADIEKEWWTCKLFV